MSTRKRENTFQHSSQYLLSLTYQDFNKSRQEDMIRMTQVPTTPPPSTDKPFPSHTSTSKTRPVFLSQHVDIFDESNCDSTEATLLNKDESDPSPSPTVKSPSNLLATKRAFTRVHFTFPEESKKLIIEEHKDAKVTPSTHPPQLGAINLLLNPSQLTLLTFVLHLRSHLKTWINLMSVTPPAPTLVTSLHYPNS